MSEILNRLDSQQRAAAECVGGPVVIYAGAGTGKTRTITHRIAYGVTQGVYEPTQTLAVTFTTRAAGELRSRLASLGVHGVQVRTFHSAALRQLRFFYPEYFATSLPELVNSKFQYVAQAASRVHVSNSTDTIRDLVAEIEWAKVNLLSPESYRNLVTEQRRVPQVDLSIEEIAKVYDAYTAITDESHVMDFEDVLLLMTAMLDNFPEVASAIHKQYKFFTVDEFQDVSPVQFELLNLWVGNRQDLCVVGDPAQTIYSFSGATSSYLRQFVSHFPQAQEFELTHSYRSTPEILAVANQVLAKDSSDTFRLQATRNSGSDVTINSYSDDITEAKEIAKTISSLVAQGTSPRDIAILYRINSQSEIFEAELSALGLPITLRGAERFFERPEVKTALLHLRAGLVGDSNRTLTSTVSDILSSVGWAVQSPDSGRSALEKWESLNTLVDLAREYENAYPKAVLPDFVSMLDKRNEQEHVPTANAITLASIHAAKGLEWDCVFVVGLSQGLLPILHAKSPDEFAEERRLFYVAITRAKSRLSLSWAQSRNPGISAHREISPFLRDLSVPHTSASGIR